MKKTEDPQRSRKVEDPERSRKVEDPERSRRVRVRYAPSPTGVPHIGNIRTALFDFLYAKNQDGTFILRLEDTDRKRLVPGSREIIQESLSVLGLKWDEYYEQSRRLDLYQKHLKILKDQKLVYEDQGSWRFKIPKGKTLKWQDLVHGEIKFLSDVLEDFIIVKSDGFPTYHFASVVDDHDMQISHVIRGEDHLSNTQRQLLIQEALGFARPEYAHIPLILAPDKTKLSKRHGATSVLEYRDQGYLPETMRNYLALLGWSTQESENIFVITENELQAADLANLKFIPYCSSVRDISNLEIYVNNKKVFSNNPVCDKPYNQAIPKNVLNAGENNIVFKTKKGTYSIEQIRISLDF